MEMTILLEVELCTPIIESFSLKNKFYFIQKWLMSLNWHFFKEIDARYDDYID
jgi:hypothetical protein